MARNLNPKKSREKKLCTFSSLENIILYSRNEQANRKDLENRIHITTLRDCATSLVLAPQCEFFRMNNESERKIM